MRINVNVDENKSFELAAQNLNKQFNEKISIML